MQEEETKATADQLFCMEFIYLMTTTACSRAYI
jgi:hypothetical protein